MGFVLNALTVNSTDYGVFMHTFGLFTFQRLCDDKIFVTVGVFESKRKSLDKIQKLLPVNMESKVI